MANTSEQNMDWTSSERGQGPVAHWNVKDKEKKPTVCEYRSR